MVKQQIFIAPNGNKISAPVGTPSLEAFVRVLQMNIKIAEKKGRIDLVARDMALLDDILI